MTVATILFATASAQTKENWWQEDDSDDTQALTEILGASPLGWEVVSKERIIKKVGRRSVLSSGDKHVNLTGSTVYGTNLEYKLVFRLNPPDAKTSAGVTFRIAVKNPGDAKERLIGAFLANNADQPVATCHVYGTNNTYKTVSTYYLKGVTTRSLGWPEVLRKSVEKDMAALPSLSEKWMAIRYVVGKNSIQTYLDDRLFDVRREDGLDLNGKVHISLYPNTSIASFRVRPLGTEDPVYQPVPIQGYVNASEINGRKIQRDSLPVPDSVCRVGNTPFLFPEPDERDNDHISIKKSWAQFGAMEGYFESHVGEFGGRWPTAMNVNPARIQLRIPNDSYTKLHLIAATDDDKNSVPIVTAQFYRAASGFPKSFEGRVPLFSAKSMETHPSRPGQAAWDGQSGSATAKMLPVKLEDGRSGALYLVTIPLDPGELSGFSDLDIVELELTKEVKQYRSYPDPICYSFHQAGRPSGVHIYALTLERSPVHLDFKPDKFGHVWTAPAKPSYTVTLRNRAAAARPVDLELSTLSHDGKDKTTQKQTVTVQPGDQPMSVKFAINDLKKFGYHDVTLTMKDGDQTWTEKRSLAQLAPETREKGGWEDGRGPLLGYWAWGGGHHTPSLLEELTLMAEAGAETCLGELSTRPPEVQAMAEKNGMFTSLFFSSHSIYDTCWSFPPLSEKWDPSKPEASAAALMEVLRKQVAKPSAVTKPIEVIFFPEPGIGLSTFGILPEYYGEPDYTFTPDEEKLYQTYLNKFLIGARAIRKEWPHTKLLLPHGDPGFVIPFLRRSPEARELIDGVGLDMPQFERMPESQLHQVTMHRLYQMNEEFRKAGKKPFLSMHEGTCPPTPPGALPWDEQADIYTRNFLFYFAYGVYRHPSGPTPFDCGNYWGEEHYGGCGLFYRIPWRNPKPSYVAYATLSRHLNRANFEKWLPTGSLSAYCMQFKHYKTGKLIHSLWTVRGKRPATLTVPAGAQITHFDEDDNAAVLAVKDGQVTFTIDPSPCYVEGLAADPQVSLGESDHSDSVPAENAVKIGSLGDGSWKLVLQEDKTYENNHPFQMARFPGKMSAVTAEAPPQQGAKALAVRLGKQEKERKVMPWYTTLVPNRPITIPGKAGHVGLWVKASSDWGRVVYCLKDARGEQWISIGTKEQWNCDDTHLWSFFNFDGWRYLRFEMPSNSAYDNFRELGSTWWGHFGQGDGIVDLPLSLEKIIVERRTHVMYVNDPQPTRSDDVLFGDLYAEYETPFDKTDDVVRQSRIRMPVPEGIPGLDNPIKAMEAKGVGEPTVVTRVEPPAHEYDGTRCHVHFDKISGATSYDIWVSPYPDGTGALKLGTAWKEPGQLLTGLRPEVDFHLFAVYTDKDGSLSKPSKPFKIRLKDMFGMK
ncbi:MAG: hypothetical protein HY360_13365 [Verrucomicrobia bacterium]|nr:hypothetical protein [Verrucomicrobiota bacterium]